jgi:hypothetical protein
VVSVIPAGSRLLAEDLLPWSTAINDTHTLSLLGGSVVKLRTTDSATRSLTTTFASDTVLTYAGVPAGTYLVECDLRWTATGANPDIKIAFVMPSGGTVIGSTFRAQPTTATGAVGTIDTGFNAGPVGSGSSLGGRGSFAGALSGNSSGAMVLTNSGTVALQWAPNTSDAATLRLDAGSWMRLTRIA